MFVRIVGIGKHSLLVRWVLFFCPKYTWDTLGIHQNQERIHVDTRRIHLDTRWKQYMYFDWYVLIISFCAFLCLGPSLSIL